MSTKKFIKLSLTALLALSLVACGDKTKDNVAFKEAGTFDKEETITTAEILADDVILQNKTIDGDLYINVPGNGSVTLSNVTVKGSIYVNMEKKVAYDFLEKVKASGTQYLINLFDVVCNNIEIENFPVRLVASGTTNINMVKTNSDITLQEQNITKNGFNDVTIMNGSKVEVTLLAAGIRQLNVANSANVELLTDTSTLIEMLTADSPVNIYGGATINLLKANADVTADSEPQSIVVGESGSFNGKKDPNETTTTSSTTTTTSKKVTTTPKKTTTTKKTTVTTTTPYVPPVTTTTTTTAKPNTAPVITAEDVTIMIDTTFNPLTGVTIYDAEDGYITVTSANIKSNNVDVSRRGTYTVTYIYVDKGGLSTTLTRKVTVSNQLDAPKNVKVGLNKYGEVEVSWDAVANASSYTIFIGREEVGYTSKTNYVIDLSYYEDSYRDFTVGVSAEHRYDDIKSSDISKVTFEVDNGNETIPEYVKVSSTATKMNYRISPIGVDSTRVYAEVRLSNENGIIANTYITTKDKTDRYGKAELDYDVNRGINFEILFDQVGIYELMITVKDDKTTYAHETFEIDVTRSGSGSSSGQTGFTKPTLVSWEAGDTWSQGADLVFSLNNDFDLSKGDSAIDVEFYWSSQAWVEEVIRDYGKETEHVERVEHGGNEGIIYRSGTKVLGGDTVRANEQISVTINSKSSGTDSITEDYMDGCKVYIYAIITVTDDYGTEKATKTNTITFLRK